RQTGWLVKEHSVNALAAALTEAAASRPRAAEFGVNARKWVEGRFGIDAMCKSYATVYRELAGSTAAAHFPSHRDTVDG
ncbi:MAG: hypothetical protein KGL97_18510, partial [Alphaproteobacteria bacterium]|nr:hypothetical protein [Alphaproteobacteria bacterium]